MNKLKLWILCILLVMTACESSRIDSVVMVTVDGMSPRDVAVVNSIHSRAASFENAVTPCPVTLPAMTTLMTGIHPAAHGVEGSEYWMLNDTAVTLSEVFQTNGMRTAAFIGAGDLGPENGLDQGFDKYSHDFESIPAGPFAYTVYLPADSVTRKAVGWLKIFGDKPYFLWVHYGDLASGWVNPLNEAGKKKRLENVAVSIDKLIKSLPGDGKNTMLILTSPAANAMGSHGELGHGTLLYNSTIRIPLAIAGPGLRARKFDEPVSLEDLYTTIISLMNFTMPLEVQGRDLAPLLRGGMGPPDDRKRMIVTAEPFYRWGLSPLKGLIVGKHKIIEGPGGNLKLYDMENDPDEKRDLATSEKTVALKMKNELTSLEGIIKRATSHGVYFMPVNESPSILAPPEEKVKALELFGKAAMQFREEKFAEAYSTLTEASKIDPSNKRIAVALALVGEESQPADQVIQLWERAAKLNPGDTIVSTSLAELLYEKGDPERALLALNDAFDAEQENPDARMLAVQILFEKAARLNGEEKIEVLQQAFKHAIEVVRVDYSDGGMAYFKIGEAALIIADTKETLPPEDTKEKNDIRVVEVETYRRAAENSFHKALQRDPKLVESYLALGKLSIARNKPDEARSNLKRYLKLAPDGPDKSEAEKLLKSLPPSKPKDKKDK